MAGHIVSTWTEDQVQQVCGADPNEAHRLARAFMNGESQSTPSPEPSAPEPASESLTSDIPADDM